jgi:hypothetical protein
MVCLEGSPVSDDAMSSRSGESSADGKLNVHIPVVVSEQMAEDIVGCAFACKKSKSEYIRDVLIEHLYGKKAAIQARIGGAEPDRDTRNVA